VGVTAVVLATGLVAGGTAPPEPTQPFPELEALLLTVDDLGENWEAASPAFSGYEDPMASPSLLFMSCLDLEVPSTNDLTTQSAGEVPTAFAQFLREDDVREDFFIELVHRTPDDETGEEWLDEFDQMIEDCPTWTNDAGATTTYTPISLDLGDASVGVRATYSGPSENLVALIAVDDYVVGLTLFGGELDDEEVAAFAETASTAVDRIQSAGSG
jgi:hypothetical protein